MLAELRIQNFVLIDSLSLTFGPGLNVLSGETGAGKSIVLDALNLLLGGKATPEMLRDGADEAVVEGVFHIASEPWVQAQLTALGLEPADDLWIRRVISRAGRGRVHINGSPAVLGALRSMARGLVDFSSQNEHQVLLDPASHLDILDQFGNLKPLLTRMTDAATALHGLVQEQKALLERQRSRAEREEFLRFQIGELDRLAPRAGEDDELEAERKLLSHAEKLHQSARQVEESLYSGRGAVIEVLGGALHKMQEIVAIDQAMEPHVQSLQAALFSVEDVARAMTSYGRRIQFNPARLEELGQRLADLSAARRKYRTDLDGIIARHKELKLELSTMEHAEERLEALEQALQSAGKKAWAIAEELSAARVAAARELEARAETELQSLSMPRARFVIDVQSKGIEKTEWPTPAGVDKVEFYLSANAGESLRPLAKVASGGELSRVLLAVKRALSGAGEVGTFVFDEVDAGIGGAVAEVVGRKLCEIAAHRQLLCITHLAQIASYADRHFTVRKEIVDNRTRSVVEPLDRDRRVEEIARMLGGLEITTRTREYAREMIDRCEAFKASREDNGWQS